MNVAAAPPPTAAPSDTGAASIAGPAQGGAAQGQGAGAKGAAPTGFDALLAMVGAALAPEGAAEGDAEASKIDAATDGAQTTVTDPLAAALAAMMAMPAQPLLDTPPAATGDAALSGASPELIVAPPIAATPVAPPAASPAAAAPVATPELPQVAEAVVAPPPAATAPPAEVLAAMADIAPPPVKPASPAKTATAPAKAESAAPTAAVTEAGPSVRPVETETANAVAALSGDSKAGEGFKPETSAAPAAQLQPTQGATQPAPTVDFAAMAASSSATAATPEVRGSPDTVAKLSADIIKKLEGASTHFNIALDPHGLGHVDVRVEINHRGDMTAALSFDNPNAAAELRGRSSELRSALQAAGFDLPDSALSFDVASGGGGGAGRDGAAQQAFDEQNRRGSAFAGRAFQATADGAESLVASLSTRLVAARDGVDIRI